MTTDVVEVCLLDPLRRLPDLAARLGVDPISEAATNGFYLCTQDGRTYDVFDLANALLDRIEAIERGA